MGNVSSGILLGSLGWSFPPEEELDRFTTPESKRMIVVISHTSYWDFVLLLLARMADQRMKENLYLVMKPQPFQLWGWFLRPLGCLPATKAEEQGEGFVNKTIRQFEGQDIRLIISPEGKREASPWRSGYYHLCQGMKSSVMVGGLDYERKALYMGKIHPWSEIKDWPREKLEQTLQQEMGQIVPLHPESSYTKVTRPYDPDKICAIEPFVLIVLAVIIVLIIVVIVLLAKDEPSS